MKDKLIVWSILITLMIIAILPGFVHAQTSPNTPSGYSIDATTGNLITNSAMTSNTGWTTSGMTGSYTPDGYIFSYASGTVQQSVNLAAINFGYQNTSAVFATGILYGFKYRFQCANSIGSSCEAGTTQDTLNSTFTYTAPNGTVEKTNVYQLGLKNINDGNPAYNPTWQQLAETYTFSGAKPINTVGTARLSITGMDAGFWGCNPDCYGPQVKDAYMRLNYSVDPCILNPAFNPSCPGFQNVLQGSKSPTFYYSYNIAQSLPHIGGGVVLHGYDYGFNWYNYGACYNTFLFWCTDWRTDGGGNINFRISDKNNTTMLQQQWYVGGNNSGGSYSNRHLFTESKNSLDMGSVQWWTDSVWNHFGWTGWTRPVWTPDPCYTNGLYSPNCSNFQETLTKVIADIKTQQEKIAALNPSSTSTTPTGSIITTINDVNSTNPSVTVTTINDSAQQNRTITTQNNQALVTTEIPAIVTRNANQNARLLSTAQRAVFEANQVASTSVIEAETVSNNLTNASIASSIQLQGLDQLTQGIVQINKADQNNISLASLPQSSLQKQQSMPVQQPKQQEQILIDSTITGIELIQPIQQLKQQEQLPVTYDQTPMDSAKSVQQLKQQEQVLFDNIQITVEYTVQPIQQLKSQEQIVNVSSVAIPEIVEQIQQPKQKEQPLNELASQTNVQNIIEPTQQMQQPKQQEQATTTATPITVEAAAQILMPNAIFKSAEIVFIPPTLPAINQTRIQEERQEQPLFTSSNQEQPAQVSFQPLLSTETQQTYVPPLAASITLPLQLPFVNIEAPIQVSLPSTAPVSIVETEQLQQQRNFTTDKTNPINDIIENKSIVAEQGVESQQYSSLNKNIQNNEVALGVNINNIAVVPVGFNAYSIALKDVAFYEPKEIYRNQRTVDNRRALQNLRSDQLHQQMIEQQWR